MSAKNQFKLSIELDADGELSVMLTESQKLSSFQMKGRILLLEDEERLYGNLLSQIESTLFSLVINGEVTDYRINGNMGASK